jgi:hypothetical protein
MRTAVTGSTSNLIPQPLHGSWNVGARIINSEEAAKPKGSLRAVEFFLASYKLATVLKARGEDENAEKERLLSLMVGWTLDVIHIYLFVSPPGLADQAVSKGYSISSIAGLMVAHAPLPADCHRDGAERSRGHQPRRRAVLAPAAVSGYLGPRDEDQI